MENNIAKTPLEDLRAEALKHYEQASSAIHCWSSFVENAIKAYNPINQEGSLKDSDWKEKFNDWMSRYFEGQYTPKGMAADLARQWIEENVIAPLLQKEYKGDDLVAEQRNIITEMLAVYNKFVHAINNSNMKGTILHVELKTVVKKAEQYAKRK